MEVVILLDFVRGHWGVESGLLCSLDWSMPD